MSTIDQAYSEKRNFLRLNLEAAATLHHAGQTYIAICKDLSSTGLLLEAKTTLKLTDKVSVLIQSEHPAFSSLEIEAEVVRITDLADERQAIGLAVTQMR